MFLLSAKTIKKKGLLLSPDTSRSNSLTHLFKIYLCSFPLALLKLDASDSLFTLNHSEFPFREKKMEEKRKRKSLASLSE